MLSLKAKIVITVLLVSFGYFILSAFINFVMPIYQRPSLLLSSVPLWSLVAMVLIFSVWAYSVLRSFQSIYMHLRYGSIEDQVLKGLEKKRKSLDVFLEVAQREFMKRRISKQTFEDIQRIAGKKIVEIKAREKELEQSEQDEAGNEEEGR
jgi:hypothetical protein